MDWIDFISFRYDAEHRNEVGLFEDHSWTGEIKNPEGIAECSHGIQPVEMRNRVRRVSLETTRWRTKFGINVFVLFKSVFMSSLSGFLSVVNPFYLELKSEATFGRPYPSFYTFLKRFGQAAQTTVFFSSKNWRLI